MRQEAAISPLMLGLEHHSLKLNGALSGRGRKAEGGKGRRRRKQRKGKEEKKAVHSEKLMKANHGK